MLSTSTDVDALTLNLNPGETLTLVGTPSTSTLQLTITILDPSGNIIATATAPAQGANAVIETAPITAGGVYTIQISDAGGNTGLYSIQAYLNSYVKQGTSNDTIGTATDISSSSYALGTGGADRLAVVGSLPASRAALRATSTSRPVTRLTTTAPPEILRVDAAGMWFRRSPSTTRYLSLSGVELSPYNNMLYAAVTTSFNSSSVSGELLEYDPDQRQAGRHDHPAG